MNTQDKNVPALRFPEFEEDWEMKNIEDCFVFKNGLNKEKEYFGKGTPIINFTDVFNKSALDSENICGLVTTSKQEKENYSARKGDVFFTRTSETINEIGMAAVLIEEIKDCVFSGFVLRARPKNNLLIDSFKKYCFSTPQIRKEIVTKSSFTTRALTSGTLLNKVIFKFPKSTNEQEKIATFLTAVDEKIQQLNKKKALLEQYKKGLLQKIFSQEIRFKNDDGNSFADWEEKQLSEVLDYEQPTKYLVSDTEYKDEYEIPVLTAGKTFILGYTNETTGIFKDKLPVIIFDDFTTANKFVDFPFKAKSSAMKILHPKNGMNLKFIYEAMQNIEYVIGGHERHWISKYSYLTINLPCPEEQQKIAKFLSAIDKKINLVNQQLEKTKEYKKGLLQQMFI